MRILAIDDERLALESLKDAIRTAAPEAEVIGFRYADEVLEYAERNVCDVAFCDIRMIDMNGLTLAEKLKEINPRINIIFATGYSMYHEAAFTMYASGYLLKPVTAEKLNDVLLRACAEISRRRERCMKIKTSAGLSILPFDEICFVELKRKSLLYYTAENHTLESTSVRESFSSCVSQLLEDKRFLLAGPGHCINLFYVKSVEKESLLFKNDIRLYLPRKICASIQAAWLDYWLEEDVRE